MAKDEIKNWLKQSIQKAQTIKKAQIQATKSRCLQQISRNVKKKMKEQQELQDQKIVDEIYPEQLEEDQEILPQDEEIIPQDEEIDLSLDQDEDELMQDQQELTLQTEDELMQDQQELTLQDEEILPQMEDELIQGQEIDLDELTQDEDELIQDEESLEDIFDEEQEDVQLNEYIRSVLQSEQTIMAQKDQETVEQCGKKGKMKQYQIQEQEEDQLIENLVSQNKKLKKRLLQVSKSFDKVNSTLKETALLGLKTRLMSKLFDNNNLNKSQKIKVIQQFDRARNERETRLVYTSLKESLNSVKSRKINKSINIPRKIRTTKPKTSIKQNKTKEDINTIKLRKLFKSRLQG